VMSQDEVIRHLTDVAEFINATQPDLLFIQEIDVDSKRSAFVEQLEWLLNHTHLNYGVYASQWKASFIPSNGLGRMNSGVAILSRWPLSDARRIALPLIKEQNPLVRYFYLKRCLLECTMDINGGQVTLLTTHTEPYAADGTKKRQLDQIFNRLVELD
ncbi:endonuclease/exonuclease/phosphatase family protein, partial [Desulfonatronum sp. SC1]|uniref:endonuclease/exonuclease/phosphatase family protein n=1 Tax=Desulfonatronum sp. SC1 TaxID=2109626 RepID=UPI0018EEA4BF